MEDGITIEFRAAHDHDLSAAINIVEKIFRGLGASSERRGDNAISITWSEETREMLARVTAAPPERWPEDDVGSVNLNDVLALAEGVMVAARAHRMPPRDAYLACALVLGRMTRPGVDVGLVVNHVLKKFQALGIPSHAEHTPVPTVPGPDRPQ